MGSGKICSVYARSRPSPRSRNHAYWRNAARAGKFEYLLVAMQGTRLYRMTMTMTALMMMMLVLEKWVDFAKTTSRTHPAGDAELVALALATAAAVT